jgi:hypothetical protein
MASSPKQPRTELYSPTYTGNIGSSLAESFFVSVSCVELWIVIVNCELWPGNGDDAHDYVPVLASFAFMVIEE